MVKLGRETFEYGITAYALTLNDGMLYVLEEATPNVVNNEDLTANLIYPFKIYPNPSHGDFKLEVQHQTPSPVSLSLYNLRGQMLFQTEYPSLPAGKNVLDISLPDTPRKIPTGLYILKLKNASGLSHQRIMLR